MDVELRDLSSLVAVAEQGSVSAAARVLGMAQPPLTRRLRALERRLGLPLLVPGPRGTTLTAAGRELAARAVDVLDRAEAAVSAARALAARNVDVVRLGYTDNMTGALVAPLLTVLAADPTAPVVEPQQLPRREQVARVRTSRLDVALLWGPVRERGLVVEPLHDHPMVVTVPAGHRLADRTGAELPELADDRFVTVRNSGGLDRRAHLVRRCRAAGFTPVFGPTAPSLAAALTAVAARQGVHVGPATVADPTPPGVVPVPIHGWTTELVAVLRERPAPVVRATLSALLDLLDRPG